MSDRAAAHGEVAQVAPDLQWFRSGLLIVIALCTYLHVPLVAGGRLLVPSFPTVALAPLLYWIVRSNISRSDEFFLPKVAFVLLLSIAFSPGYKYVGEKFFGLIQCVMAIGVTILIVRLMQQIKIELLERALLVLWLIVIVGSVLEVFGVIREISDSFRVWAYSSQYTLYDSDLRDIDLVGWPRPKLFSVEPSHVTKLFVASINAWLLVRVTWRKVAIVAAATLIILTIMGSPMLFVSAAISAMIVVWNRNSSLRVRAAMIVAALIIGVLFITLSGESTYSNVAGRLENVTDVSGAEMGRPGSEQQRMIYPYLTLANTWLRWPLFGVGVGGKEVVIENTAFRLDRPESALGNNAMAEIGIYLGLIGSVWFAYLLLRQARDTGIYRLGLLTLVVALFSQLMGGMASFQYWGFIALLWGALAVADNQQKERGDMPSVQEPRAA